MSIVRFISTFIAAYILYAVLYILIMAVALADVYAVNADLLRPQTDPTVMYAYVGHVLQTISVVWLFDKVVGSSDIKAGAVFGFFIGLYLAGTDISYFYGFNMDTGPVAYSVVIHLVVGMVIGAFLSVLYGMGRGKEGGEPEGAESSGG